MVSEGRQQELAAYLLPAVALSGIAISMLVQGCGKREQIGTELVVSSTTPIVDILRNPAAQGNGSVKVEGRIASQDPSGRWFELEQNGAAIRVNVSTLGLTVPRRVGRHAVVEGSVRIFDDRVTVIGHGLEIR